MKALEESVRAVEMEGLVWGASKLVPIGYGIRKLQITLVVGTYLTRVLITVFTRVNRGRTRIAR